jgi:hypothetical protein
MVNDPEREDLGGNEPMGDPAETGTRVGGGGDLGVGPEGGNTGVEETPEDDTLTEGSPRERNVE